jgi:2-hydroxychromene-2-carboxylate isomerase
MAKVIDFYLCMNSPWVYLGQKRLEEIAAAAGAEIDYRPVDLKEMMLTLIGAEDPPERPAPQRAYGKIEMQRWADFRGLPINLKPRYYPVSQNLAARLVIAARRFGADAGALAFALPRATWAEDRDIGDPQTLNAICEENGLPGDILLAAAEDDGVIDEFMMNTEEALKRDVFGIPSYVFDGQIYWGQDRLDFLERALATAA